MIRSSRIATATRANWNRATRSSLLCVFSWLLYYDSAANFEMRISSIFHGSISGFVVFCKVSQATIACPQASQTRHIRLNGTIAGELHTWNAVVDQTHFSALLGCFALTLHAAVYILARAPLDQVKKLPVLCQGPILWYKERSLTLGKKKFTWNLVLMEQKWMKDNKQVTDERSTVPDLGLGSFSWTLDPPQPIDLCLWHTGSPKP